RQMRALAHAATVVGAGHVGRLKSGRRYVAVTFDDAFRSVAENVVPELLRNSLSATVFVPVGVLGEAPTWREKGGSNADGDVVMTVDELRSLPEIVQLGSHSLTHPHLTALDHESLREEVV